MAAQRKPKQDLYAEVGATGVKRYGGYIDEEFEPTLKGERGRRVIREMLDNDPIVGACWGTVRQFVRGATYHVEPADDTPQAAEVAAFVDSCLHSMRETWQDTLSDVCTVGPYGWSWHEVVYQRRDDGRLGWACWSIRGQDTLSEWIYDDAGALVGMRQAPPPTYRAVDLPIDRCLHFRTESARGNPEGRSLFRNAYVPYYYARRIRQIEAIGIERDLAGLPVIWAPPDVCSDSAAGAKGTFRDSLKTIVKNIRRDEQEGVLFPLAYDSTGHKLYDLTLLTSGGARQFDTTAVIARYTKEIAMSLFCDFLLFGHENVGSFALVESRRTVFGVAVAAFIDTILSTINRFAVPRLVALNGWNAALTPHVCHGAIEAPDLTTIGDYVAKLAGAGFPLFTDAELQARLLTMANLPAGSAAGVMDAGEAE